MRAKLSAGRWVFLGAMVSACAAGDVASTPPPPDAALDAADEDVAPAPDAALDALPTDIMVTCGDGICTRGAETCETCPLDCNRCPTCDMAPSCTGALAVPLASTRLPVCDNALDGNLRSNFACGTDLGVAPSATTCADPQLRIRVKEIAIQRGFFDLGSNLYCVISAEDGRHSELLLVTPRSVSGNRNTTTINLRPSEGLLWGQGDLYRSISNITITYGCFLASNSGAAQRVLNDISGRAGMVAQHADGYGWVFGTVAVLGTILGSAIGTMGDTRILDVQQTVAAGALLPLTNARTWDIRSRGGNLSLSGAHDLRLTLESWGCAGVRSVAP